MSEVLRIAATVGTPLALLGLVVALGYYIYSRRLKYEEKKLEALPPDERATRTDEYLTRYGIDGKKLRLADKLALIRDELEKRHRRSFGYVIVAAVVFTVCFGLAVLAFIVRPSQTNAVTPPADTTLTALTLHQELSKVRDVLSQPPRQDRPTPEKYPHPYESGELAKWNEPRSSSINQIVMLAEIDPHAVLRALVPLLSDSDGVVVAGALYALRDIITQKPDEKKKLDKLIPKGDDAFLKHELRLNLRDTYIVNQDFSALAGIDLFYAAQFQGAVLENVTFDGLVLKRTDFGRSTILECSFRNTDLERSSWRDARVRSTDFTGANMFSMFAHSADFGTATSDPTTLFPGNRFLNAMLNDADLNRASMVGVDLERASLNSAQFVGADFTDAYFDGTLVSEQLLRGAGVVLLNEETKYSTTPAKPNTTLQPSAPTTISNARVSVTPKTIKPRDKFTLTASFELSTKANIGTASIKAVRKVNVDNETGDILDLGSHSISSDDKAYSFDLYLDSPSTGVAATRTELATDIVKRYFDVQVWVQLNGKDTMVGQDQLIVATEEENPN